jgi:hypothetical protein
MTMMTLILMLVAAGLLTMAYSLYRKRTRKVRMSAERRADQEDGVLWTSTSNWSGSGELPRSSSWLSEEGVMTAVHWLGTREKVQLAVLAAAFLAIAQFFTTAKGLSNFIPWLAVAIMAAIGVQVILYLSAWLLAERSAHKAYLRRREQASDGSDSEEIKRARLAFRSAGNWAPLMFATGFFVSVFFSNDALFDFVYVKAQQDLNNVKVARSTIGAMFGTIEGKLRDDRNAEVKELRDSKEWNTWQAGLSTILATAENSRDILQASWNAQRARLEVELAALRKQETDKTAEVATLKARVESGGSLSMVTPAGTTEAGAGSQIKTLQKREQDLLDTVSKLDQQRGDIKVSLDNEAKVGGVADGKRRPEGQGPVWREFNRQLLEIQTTLAARKEELAGVQRNLASAIREQDNQAKSATQELEKAKAGKEIAVAALDTGTRELNDLRRSVKEAEARYDTFMGQAGSATSATSGAGDMVLNVRRALTAFTGSGSRESFKTMFDGCNALMDMLEREPQTKKLIGAASCDTSAFAQRIDRLASYDDAAEKYRKACQVDDTFNALPLVKDMVDRARTCAGISTLPFARIKDERNDIDRIEQENSPNTSHFERTISTLRRGDTLAWLALGIAFSIDFLVLIAAMIGARATVSPLVRDGHVASQADIDDLNISQNIDLKIYPNDPPAIRNQKTLLSLLSDDGTPSAESKSASSSIIDLHEVPPELVAGISALLQTYVAKRLAQHDRQRSGVYHIESSLVMQMTRNVGLYERAQQNRRTRAEWEQGYDIKQRDHWGAGRSFDDFPGSFTSQAPFEAAPPSGPAARKPDNGPTSSASANGNSAKAQNEEDSDASGSGWSNLRSDDGGKTKKFYN